MFLQYGSYGKQVFGKQQRPKNIDKSPAQIPDEFAFSDFFIRKHPKIPEFHLFKDSQH